MAKKITIELWVDDWIVLPPDQPSYFETFKTIFSILPFSTRIKEVHIEESKLNEPSCDLYNDKWIRNWK